MYTHIYMTCIISPRFVAPTKSISRKKSVNLLDRHQPIQTRKTESSSQTIKKAISTNKKKSANFIGLIFYPTFIHLSTHTFQVPHVFLLPLQDSHRVIQTLTLMQCKSTSKAPKLHIAVPESYPLHTRMDQGHGTHDTWFHG